MPRGRCMKLSTHAGPPVSYARLGIRVQVPPPEADNANDHARGPQEAGHSGDDPRRLGEPAHHDQPGRGVGRLPYQVILPSGTVSGRP